MNKRGNPSSNSALKIVKKELKNRKNEEVLEFFLLLFALFSTLVVIILFATNLI